MSGWDGVVVGGLICLVLFGWAAGSRTQSTGGSAEYRGIGPPRWDETAAGGILIAIAGFVILAALTVLFVLFCGIWKWVQS